MDTILFSASQCRPAAFCDLMCFHHQVTVRGEKVLLDMDLACIYGVPTKRLNEQVRRNLKRFPSGFMFQLTSGEAKAVLRLRSQIATASKRNARYVPYAFTERGAIIVANVLNSPQAARNMRSRICDLKSSVA